MVKPLIREFTKNMFEQQKWVMLIRDGKDDKWRPFGHRLSGKVYIYGDLDKAIGAQKSQQFRRFKSGDTLLMKVEEFNRQYANQVQES